MTNLFWRQGSGECRSFPNPTPQRRVCLKPRGHNRDESFHRPTRKVKHFRVPLLEGLFGPVASQRRTSSSLPMPPTPQHMLPPRKNATPPNIPLLGESLATGQHFTDSSRQSFIIGHGRTSGEESGSDFPLVVLPQPRAHFGSGMPLAERALCLPRPPRVRRGLSPGSP